MPNLAKDFHRLYKRIGRLSDRQASITDVNWDDSTLTEFTVVIQPNSGYYKGGSFKFVIGNLVAYNGGGSPEIICVSRIFHPNIDSMTTYHPGNEGNVCLNIFDSQVAFLGLEGVVLGLLFLLNHPNFDDPLSPYFDGYVDHEDFNETIQSWIGGKAIHGIKYGSEVKMIDDDNNGDDDCEVESESESDSDCNGTPVDAIDESVKTVEVHAENMNTEDITVAEQGQTNTVEHENESTSPTEEELSAQIEAFVVAESVDSDTSDEIIDEDYVPSLLTVDGEVLMTFQGHVIDPFVETDNTFGEGNEPEGDDVEVQSQYSFSDESLTESEDENANDISCDQNERLNNSGINYKHLVSGLAVAGVLIIGKWFVMRKH